MKHEIGSQFCQEFTSKQPAAAKTPERTNMPETLDCREDPYTSMEHAVTDDVPVQIAVRSGKNRFQQNDFERGAEIFQQIKREDSSRLSQKLLSFSQTSVLTDSDYKEHLFNIRASPKLYDTGVQHRVSSLQMEFVSELCDTGRRMGEETRFFWRMWNQY